MVKLFSNTFSHQFVLPFGKLTPKKDKTPERLTCLPTKIPDPKSTPCGFLNASFIYIFLYIHVLTLESNGGHVMKTLGTPTSSGVGMPQGWSPTFRCEVHRDTWAPKTQEIPPQRPGFPKVEVPTPGNPMVNWLETVFLFFQGRSLGGGFKLFFLFILGKMFTHFGLRIFFKWVESTN